MKYIRLLMIIAIPFKLKGKRRTVKPVKFDPE